MLEKKHMDEEFNFEEDNFKITGKDILAAIIAEFQILLPIVIGSLLIMWLFVMFIFKVWLRQ